MYDKETGIFTHSHKQKLDKDLVSSIGRWCAMNKLQTLCDLGCDSGLYCRYLYDNWGIECTGYEGNKHAISKKDYRRIVPVDLSEKGANIYNTTYDFVLCLEVGEHIPKDKCEDFVDNVVSFAEKDILLSWATPERKGGGVGHVNELRNEEVIKLMKVRGFNLCQRLTKTFRNISTVRWFKTNLMYFWRD